MQRFFDGGLDDLSAVFGITDDGIVIEFKLLAAHFSLEDLGTLLDFIAEADAVVLAEKLKHGEQFPVGRSISVDRGIDTRTEHLF